MTEFKKKNSDYMHMPGFLSPQETIGQIVSAWQPIRATELVPLAEARGRLCAGDVFARNTLPVCRAAGPDGIAVRASDFAQGIPDTTCWREGQHYVAADCGDDFDDAFDTVINIERVSFLPDGGVMLDLSGLGDENGVLTKGTMVRPRGATLSEGELILTRGSYIGAWQLGALTCAGVTEVPVQRKPVIACIPTGSELIPPGSPLERGKNIETNGVMLTAALECWGAEVRRWRIIKDIKTQLEAALDEALAAADIVIINGGSSMGSEDFCSGLLDRRTSVSRHGVRCVPGMPTLVGLIDGKAVINLPGPPFSAFCAMDWSVKALLAAWYQQPLPQRQQITATLTGDINRPQNLQSFDFYCRLQVTQQQGWQARPINMSARYAESCAFTNALAIISGGTKPPAAGERIDAEILYTDPIPSPLTQIG